MHCIANVTPNWGIGCEGRLAIAIKADLKRFKELTTGHTVLLGRKTLATFPGSRPLKNRENIILTRDENYTAEGAVIAHSAEDVLRLAGQCTSDDFWVIGGESVYAQFIPYCRTARITMTYADVPADAFFPNLDELPNWHRAEVSERMTEDGIEFQYIDYINDSPLEY